MSSRTVFVTGARGKTGREVVTQLADVPGLAVRAGSSHQLDLQDAAGVDPVLFDWSRPETWPEASAGADAIYLMRPDRPDAPELVAKLVSDNPDSHVVLVSEQGADKLAENHWVRRVEAAVTDYAKTWTVLRPSWFQQNLIDPRFFRDAIRRDRVFGMPSGGGAIAWVDVRDIAAVAVAALAGESGEHHGGMYTITGSEGVTVADIAHMLSEQIGEPVRGVEPPVSEELHGLDSWIAGILEDLYERVRVGDFGDVTDTVNAITGRQPRTIGDFIGEHGGEWH